MLYKLATHIIRNRHPWRTLHMSELAEIYTSMSMRSFGFSIMGIFVPVYLYQSGIALADILVFYLVFFVIRIPVSYLAAFLIGRIGPKHTLAMSTVITIIFMGHLLSLGTFGWQLWYLALLFTTANGLFFIATNVDFSKIKHKDHGGKELGWLYIFERGGAALGPVVGGVLASVVAPSVTIWVAIVMLCGSLIPLFLTREPIKTHQKISFRGFPWRNYLRTAPSIVGYQIDMSATLIVWPLLLSVFVFVDDPYASLGALIGLATLISLFSARMFGMIVDSRRGRRLLRYGSVINAVTHVFRAFITAPGGAVAVTTLNEPTILSYKMPYIKGLYDEADEARGYRIVYFVVAEMIAGMAKAAYFGAMVLATVWFEPLDVVRYGFIGVGMVSLAIMSERFTALKTKG